MSQAELALRAGVSRKWIYEFEAGKPNAELGLIIRVMEALGFQLELGLDEHARGAIGGEPVNLDALINEHRDR
jgi:HTH-type transcriptional regulator/antitoxin HipB